MNARYGWGTTSDVPALSHDFDRAFFQAIFQDGQTNIGKANQLSKEYNVSKLSNSTYRWIYYELNLLGDPQTALRTDSGSDPNAPTAQLTNAPIIETLARFPADESEDEATKRRSDKGWNGVGWAPPTGEFRMPNSE